MGTGIKQAMYTGFPFIIFLPKGFYTDTQMKIQDL